MQPVVVAEPLPAVSVEPAVVRGRAHVRAAAEVVVATELLADVARTADQGGRAVDAVWGTDWSRELRVIVGDRGFVEAAVGATPELPAVAATVIAPDDPNTLMVVVDQSAWATLSAAGRRVVLTHELVHLATGAPLTALPLWLEEGFADYVGWLDAGVPVGVAAREALDEVRAAGAPERLPTDADFDLAGHGAAVAYGEAYLALRLLATQIGSDRVAEVYRRALVAVRTQGTVDPPDPQRAVDEALVAVTGHGLDQLVVAWRAELRRLAP